MHEDGAPALLEPALRNAPQGVTVNESVSDAFELSPA
jgi:hypothetical protein